MTTEPLLPPKAPDPHRRWKRAALAGLVCVAAYTGLWFWAASRMGREILTQLAVAREQGATADSSDLRCRGFPAPAIRCELKDVHWSKDGIDVASPSATVSWSAFSPVTLGWSAQSPVALRTLDGLAELRFDSLTGTARQQGGLALTAASDNFSYKSPLGELAVGALSLAVDYPQPGPAKPDALSPPVSGRLNWDARHLKVNDGPVVRTSGAMALKGVVAGKANDPAIWAAWRDAGGVLELSELSLISGASTLTVNGSLALDGDFRPLGAFTVELREPAAAVDQLQAFGALKPRDALAAKLALGTKTQRQPDGAAVMRAAVSIQEGWVSVDGARLAQTPPLLRP